MPREVRVAAGRKGGPKTPEGRARSVAAAHTARANARRERSRQATLRAGGIAGRLAALKRFIRSLFS